MKDIYRNNPEMIILGKKSSYLEIPSFEAQPRQNLTSRINFVYMEQKEKLPCQVPIGDVKIDVGEFDVENVVQSIEILGCRTSYFSVQHGHEPYIPLQK